MEDFAASYLYDDAHRVTKAVSATGVTYTYGYDEYGNAKTAKIEYDDSDDSKDLYIGTSMTTVHGGNYTGTVTDALGNTVSYTYNNANEGLMTGQTDGKGTTTAYAYEEDTRKLQNVSVSYDDGFASGTAAVEYGYTDDSLTSITHNGFGNNTGVQVAGSPLVTRQYEANNGNLASVEYGNEYTYLYTYDDLDRVTELRLKDPDDKEYVLYRYEYDQDGNLSAVYDIREDIGQETIVTRYFYDMSGRLVYVRNDQDEDYRYTYDLNNNLIKVEQGNQFRLFATEYTYDKDNRETATKTQNKTFTTEYDGLGRLKSQNWNTTTEYEILYEYQAGAATEGSSGTSTSSQISKITAGGKEASYEYDANGNITKITTSDGSIRYAYDELNQLVREDNSTTQQTSAMSMMLAATCWKNASLHIFRIRVLRS